MQLDARKYLNDMLDRAKFVRDYTSDKSLEQLTHERPVRSAIERELTVLGEALYQLHKRFPDVAEQIPSWNEIIHFRHILVHGYDAIRMEVIWDIIQHDLEPLIVELEKLK